MGRMKDFGATGAAFGRRGGASWVDVTPRHKCPVCGGDSWCQVARDGATVLCKRVEGGREKRTRDGVAYFVHQLNGAAPRSEPESMHNHAHRDRAPVAVRDRAYRTVLAHLTLEAHDRDALLRRGLDAASIEANGYRTMPERDRAALARAVLEAVGETAAGGVPGIAWRTPDDGGARGWWSFAGSPGVLIPVRDVEGHVVALKVRRRDPLGDGPRYLYVTSAKHGGASAASVVHVPVAARALRGTSERLIITEGELKADVSTALLGEPVVSIPGVGAWASGVDAAHAWGVRSVAVALDMDASANRHVAAAVRCIVDTLRAEGVSAAVWRWDPRFKGLDDYLSARAAGAST